MTTRQLATASAVSGILAGFLGLALASLMFFSSGDPPIVLFVALLAMCLASAFAMMILLSLYIYFDAQSRGMNGILAVLLLLLVGPPGLVIYLLIRSQRVQRIP